MKKLFYLFGFILSNNIAFGQFIPPTPPVYNNPVFIPNYPPYFYVNYSNDISYRLKVTFKDGQSDTIVSKFYVTKNPYQVSIKNEGGMTIYPSETINILARKKNLIGIPYDSLWLFAVHTGKLNTYYFLPDTMTNTYSFIQKGAGPLDKYSKQKFKSMISDNKRALRVYNNKTICPFIGVGLFATAGIILAIIGANGGNNDPMVITGVAMGAVAIPFIVIGKNKIQKTTKIYNK